jgi:hypothetical protein
MSQLYFNTSTKKMQCKFPKRQPYSYSCVSYYDIVNAVPLVPPTPPSLHPRNHIQLPPVHIAMSSVARHSTPRLCLPDHGI